MTRHRTAPALARTLVMLALLWAGAGCTRVMLVSDYDEHIDRAASDLQRRMDRFLTGLAADTGAAAAYEPHRAFYRDYLLDLRAVELRARAHPKNAQSLEQYRLMRESLEALRSTHEAQGALGAAFLEASRELFNQSWQAIIALEVAKRRGAS